MAMALLTLIAAVAVQPLRAYADRYAVRQATAETAELFAEARRAGIRHGRATIYVTSTGVRLEVRDSVLRAHEFLTRLRVSVRSTTGAMTFNHTGLGQGIANGTVILERRAAADTLVVSRLGRVRE
jgi:hypothetical protein